MKQNSKKNYVITSLALYFTYFIHEIGASILGQYKPQFAKVWERDSGKLSGLIGVICYVIFFFGIVFSPVDGNRLCIYHCGRNRQFLPGHLCKSDLYGDLCQ